MEETWSNREQRAMSSTGMESNMRKRGPVFKETLRGKPTEHIDELDHYGSTNHEEHCLEEFHGTQYDLLNNRHAIITYHSECGYNISLGGESPRRFADSGSVDD